MGYSNPTTTVKAKIGGLVKSAEQQLAKAQAQLSKAGAAAEKSVKAAEKTGFKVNPMLKEDIAAGRKAGKS